MSEWNPLRIWHRCQILAHFCMQKTLLLDIDHSDGYKHEKSEPGSPSTTQPKSFTKIRRSRSYIRCFGGTFRPHGCVCTHVIEVTTESPTCGYRSLCPFGDPAVLSSWEPAVLSHHQPTFLVQWNVRRVLKTADLGWFHGSYGILRVLRWDCLACWDDDVLTI